VFFRWYNTVHRHNGIGLMTPHTVHYGYADQLTEERGANHHFSLAKLFTPYVSKVIDMSRIQS
jgi:hypothetical protein